MFNDKLILKFSFLLLLAPGVILAQETASTSSLIASSTPNIIQTFRLEQTAIKGGKTISAFDDIKLSFQPGILASSSEVEIIQINESLPIPWNLEKISKIYQFELKNKNALTSGKSFVIQLDYAKTDNYSKHIYLYDRIKAVWIPIKTTDFPREKFVRISLNFPFARIAVLSDHSLLTVGRASWYKHKNGLFAASPDFPKDTKIRVTNLDNDKFVDVIVNDFGPERKTHPDRVVDLDKTAFLKIAKAGSGVANIKIEPLTATGKIVAKKASAANDVPIIKSRSAIVYNETTGRVLYDKNSVATTSLASLTKLLAIKVFLDTRPSLNQVVTYKKQDENYNYEWCKPYESARLKVIEGETMTVENLLYSALVGSANNAVESLVRVSGYTRSQFIAKMNEVAAGLGATSTHFVEPTGLSPQNITTARDYAIISTANFNHPILEKASKMSEYKFTTINTKKEHIIKNTNTLIRYKNFNNYDLTGSKTGYLDEAGYCLLLRARDKKKQNIIVITFGAVSRAQSEAETEELLKYGLKQI